jgi:hypothetical protein
MKQEDLFKKLGLILDDLNEQYHFLAQNPQQLNDLELELFHANANFLADHVQIVKKISLNQQKSLDFAPIQEQLNQPPVFEGADIQEESQLEEITFANVENEEENEQVKSEPQIELLEIEQEVFKLDSEASTFEFILNDHTEHETITSLPKINSTDFDKENYFINENMIDEKFDFEEKTVDEIFNRPLSQEEERIIAEKKKLSTEPLPEIQESEEDEIGPEPFLVYKKEEEVLKTELADIILTETPQPITKTVVPVEDLSLQPTLNDLLAKSNGVNINSTTTSGIKDLKQGINLNDKLLYIKDLFNGYNLAYAEAIDLANKLPNFETADNFFQKNYAVKNNWADKQATVDRFYALLNQRFK